ncbi:MAG: PilZ domain-containing protein [Deltaproteobacteria bacterium]|nr:PilZ domain-containing protein [Deltaproteobacteria bacterium]
MENKRNFERFDLAVPARIGIGMSIDDEKEVSLVTSNICAGGAFLVTKDPIPEGTKVRLDFVLSIQKLKELLDSECRIKIEGEVVRTEETGIAIRFDGDYQILPVRGSVH